MSSNQKSRLGFPQAASRAQGTTGLFRLQGALRVTAAKDSRALFRRADLTFVLQWIEPARQRARPLRSLDGPAESTAMCALTDHGCSLY